MAVVGSSVRPLRYGTPNRRSCSSSQLSATENLACTSAKGTRRARRDDESSSSAASIGIEQEDGGIVIYREEEAEGQSSRRRTAKHWNILAIKKQLDTMTG